LITSSAHWLYQQRSPLQCRRGSERLAREAGREPDGSFSGAPQRHCSRECLACIVGTSLPGRRVVRELAAIAERRGLPCMVVSDNGTELTSHAVLAWC
jgi:hypothetical protein